MSRTRRDNVKARKKKFNRGGIDPYKKREKRQNPKLVKCNICGVLARSVKLVDGLCKMCLERGVVTKIKRIRIMEQQ